MSYSFLDRARRAAGAAVLAVLGLAATSAPGVASDTITIEGFALESIAVFSEDGNEVGRITEAEADLPQQYQRGDENAFGFLPFAHEGEMIYLDPFDVTVSTKPLVCPKGMKVAGQGTRSTAGSGGSSNMTCQ